MSVLPIAHKQSDPPLFSAADLLAHRRRIGSAPSWAPPQTVLLCHQNAPLAHALRKYRGKRVTGFHGECYLLKRSRETIAVLGGFGVGAPVVGVLVEELAAFGVTRFIALGMAGGLQESCQPGDRVIWEQAVRDEGTSHHYLPADQPAAAHPSLTRKLVAWLDHRNLAHRVGSTWTTDAPYRETAAAVAHYQRQGVLTVEMEAAALFVVGSCLGVQTAAVGVVADALHNGAWRLDFPAQTVARSLEQLLEAVVEGLIQEQQP